MSRDRDRDRDRSGKMEEKDYSSPPAPFVNQSGILRATRDFPPAHFLFKINSFSLFAGADSIEKYETGVFEAGGYKWRLLLYPKGNKKSNGCISLYLRIAQTETLPLGWQINVNFKFFVFDQIRDKYLVIEDAGKRFHRMKTEWGIDQLLLLDCFNDTSNGYLVNDSCIFGAEVFVIEQTPKLECLSMIKEPDDSVISFKIKNFSTLERKCYDSPFQIIEGFIWKLSVYPYGDEHVEGNALSLYLDLDEKSIPERGLYVKYKLRLMDQIRSNHVELTIGRWFKADSSSWGCLNFISLENLRRASRGFLVKDAFIVEAEILLMSNVECTS